MQQPSKGAQPVTLLICIREMPGSNTCRDAHYLGWGFSWLFQLQRDRFRPYPFQMINHYNPIIQRFIA
jgi:hypothetical protein